MRPTRTGDEAETAGIVDEVASSLGPELAARLERARETSRAHHGRRVAFYLPGMFRTGDRRGRYPAISITGRRCDLGCAHCGGRLLEPMIATESPVLLVEAAKKLAEDGALGVLVSGGSDSRGRLPWRRFFEALREIKETTQLQVSVHAGLVDPDTAEGFVRAGVDAALFDVVGSERCLSEVFHLEGGLAAVESSLEALVSSGIAVVPHIVIGLEREGTDGDPPAGGEKRAIEMVAAASARRPGAVKAASFVVFMPLKGTELAGAHPPELSRVADVLAYARERMPRVTHSLGCARPRNDYGARVEAVALMAGVNRLAVATDGAERAARELGLEVSRQDTCCSVDMLL